MPDEALLREKARAALRNGTLPTRQAHRTWGGPGVGAPCAICELPVTPEQLEFELEFEMAEVGGVKKLHVHLRCFAAWEFERTKVDW